MTPDPKRMREARAPLITAILAAIGLMALGYEASAADVAGNAATGTGEAWRGSTHKTRFEARVTAHASGSNAEAIFGDDFAGSRVEAAVQASF